MIYRLFSYIKPLWVRFATANVCMAGVAAISTATVWIIKYLFDHAMTEKDMEALKVGVAALVAMFFLKSILWYAHTYLTSHIGQFVARVIREDTYNHLYSLSMGFFNEKKSSSILARLTNDVTTLQFMLASAPTILVRDGLTILGLIGFLFYLNFKFTLYSLIILPVSAMVLTHLGRKSRKAGRESQEKMSDLYNVIQEAVGAMPIVQTFQKEKKEMEDFSKENQNFFNVIMRLVRIEARSSPIMEALGAIVLGFLLIIGGRDVINDKWTLGSFVAFMGAAMSLYNPIKKFAKVNVQMQQGLAAGERVFELLDQKPIIKDQPDAIETPPLSEKINFRNVSFAYPEGTTVLNHVNLEIKKGEIIAFVGPSGAGKTTLATLLLRFYDPQSGQILIDDVDLKNIQVQSLRKQIGVVTQETHLFNDSVRENIAYGKDKATEQEIIEAARAAYAHDFISALPKGYDTIIGERGVRLSGGERQRIAIARALLKNPAILILDEATSALDAASEQAVQSAIDRLLEGRTVLMIAHRLSTVKKATKIVVVENGQIKEMGNHSELLEKKGTYQKLYELQATI